MLDTKGVLRHMGNTLHRVDAAWDQRSFAQSMPSESSPGEQSPQRSKDASAAPKPDWADGLRQLYDSVVDEPLPDTFKDLLEQLDEETSNDDGCEADGSDGGHG